MWLFCAIASVAIIIGRNVVATLAALSPARLWPRFDNYPVHSRAWVSGTITAAGGSLYGLDAFLAQRLPLHIFLLGTPPGWLTSYLVVTGILRVAAAIVEEPLGDPLLTVADTFVHRARTDRLKANTLKARTTLEGPQVRDRVVPASELGVPEAGLVIVASREKPEWRVGSTVVRQGVWYRLVLIEERFIDNRLRTLYGLAPMAEADVARNVLFYDE